MLHIILHMVVFSYVNKRIFVKTKTLIYMLGSRLCILRRIDIFWQVLKLFNLAHCTLHSMHVFIHSLIAYLSS